MLSKARKQKSLELFVAQGTAYQKLLEKVNDQGRYNREIAQVRTQVKRAQHFLRLMGNSR